MRQMRDRLEWPVRDGDVDRRGADVLSGFSGQPMGDVGGYGDPQDFIAEQFIDAAAGTPEGEYIDISGDGTGDRPWKEGVFDLEYELTGGVTIIGTNDPATTTQSVDNYYFHELGHVLGAIHPDADSERDEFEVPNGTEGVMCKDSCAVDIGVEPIDDIISDDPGSSILTAEYYSEPNKDRILNINYDYRDANEPVSQRDDEPPAGSVNEARNITSVSTAASDNPRSENVP